MFKIMALVGALIFPVAANAAADAIYHFPKVYNHAILTDEARDKLQWEGRSIALVIGECIGVGAAEDRMSKEEGTKPIVDFHLYELRLMAALARQLRKDRGTAPPPLPADIDAAIRASARKNYAILRQPDDLSGSAGDMVTQLLQSPKSDIHGELGLCQAEFKP